MPATETAYAISTFNFSAADYSFIAGAAACPVGDLELVMDPSRLESLFRPQSLHGVNRCRAPRRNDPGKTSRPSQRHNRTHHHAGIRAGGLIERFHKPDAE